MCPCCLPDLVHSSKVDDPEFLRGVRPADLLNRQMCVIYTDGALEDLYTEGDGAIKGVGGVLYKLPNLTPFVFSEPDIASEHPYFKHIAPVEMHGVFRAITLFGPHIVGRSVLFFVDNTHAIGCLLKGGASVRPSSQPREGTPLEHAYTHYREFLTLSESLREQMNTQACAIWQLIRRYKLIVWFEYVISDHNIADPPSRGKRVPCAHRHFSYLNDSFLQPHPTTQ